MARIPQISSCSRAQSLWCEFVFGSCRALLSLRHVRFRAFDVFEVIQTYLKKVLFVILLGSRNQMAIEVGVQASSDSFRCRLAFSSIPLTSGPGAEFFRIRSEASSVSPTPVGPDATVGNQPPAEISLNRSSNSSTFIWRRNTSSCPCNGKSLLQPSRAETTRNSQEVLFIGLFQMFTMHSSSICRGSGQVSRIHLLMSLVRFVI